MGGSTTTHIYYLMVLEPRSLKLRYLQGHTPFEGSREESSGPLPASGCSQRSLALPAQRQSLLPFHVGCFRKICWKDKLEKPKLACCFCFSFRNFISFWTPFLRCIQAWRPSWGPWSSLWKSSQMSWSWLCSVWACLLWLGCSSLWATWSINACRVHLQIMKQWKTYWTPSMKKNMQVRIPL